jgi:hypothetical protein
MFAVHTILEARAGSFALEVEMSAIDLAKYKLTFGDEFNTRSISQTVSFGS